MGKWSILLSAVRLLGRLPADEGYRIEVEVSFENLTKDQNHDFCEKMDKLYWMRK